jgi:tetratricopeptide (TPR) repeat protein
MMSVNSTLSILMEGDDAATESRNNFIGNALGNNHTRVQLHVAIHNLYLDFVFYQQNLKECCEQFHQKEIQSGCIVFHETAHAFIAGLASYQLYRETEDFFWYERGKKRLDDIKLWADRGAAWNFSHKLNLLEAEDSFSLGDFDSAKQSYQNAITASKAHKFDNDLSLSYELAAKFYLSIGELQTSLELLEHFTLAHEAYCAWGALGKAQKLLLIRMKQSRV